MPLRSTAQGLLNRLSTATSEAFSSAATPRPPPPIDENGLCGPGTQPYDPIEGDGNWINEFWDRDWEGVHTRLHTNTNYIRFKEAGYKMTGYRVRLALGSCRKGYPGQIFQRNIPSLIMLVTKKADISFQEMMESTEADETLWRKSFAYMRGYLDDAGGIGLGLQMMDEEVFHKKNALAVNIGRFRTGKLLYLEQWEDILNSHKKYAEQGHL